MKKVLLWWLSLTVVWSIFRVFPSNELVSELVAKPIIWLGSIALFARFGWLAADWWTQIKQNYARTKPWYLVFLLPMIISVFYFVIFYGRSINSEDPLQFLLMALPFHVILNFSTAIVEEITYRGFLYAQLLKITSEWKAFGLTQALFLLSHTAIVILNFTTPAALLTKLFFVLIFSCIYTGLFRYTKSIYSSTLAHGTWNTLVATFLLL